VVWLVYRALQQTGLRSERSQGTTCATAGSGGPTCTSSGQACRGRQRRRTIPNPLGGDMFRSIRHELLLGGSVMAILAAIGGASAQDPGAQPPAPPATAPQAAPPPAPPETAPQPVPAEGGTALPTIQVAAKRAKPKQTAARPTAGGTAPAGQAAAGPPVPVSGAPNVGSDPASPPKAASEMRVTGDELLARPITRPGEVVEAAPGLIAIEHASEGKANQYYLRGYNLDHGTDLATYVDDMPINMRTHAHGQGYTDLNWLMPETVNALDIRKGPYFADEGDFANAGSLHISLRDSVEPTASLTMGSFGYERLMVMDSTKALNGTLLAAVEANTYDGPWVTSNDVRKVNGIARYAQGTATDGFSVTAMAYSSKWDSTDQVPLRAITSGQIGLYGALDPTDGGDTTRFSLSGRVAQTDDAGSWKANAYLIKYTLDLYNNFEWNTANVLTQIGVPIPTTNCWNPVVCSPLYGDQFHQRDDRVLGGVNASRTYQYTYAGLPTETTFGIQTRYDDIALGLSDTYQRIFLASILNDKVTEGSVGIYAEHTIHWTSWYRTTFGWRGDAFEGTVNSTLDPNNSGRVQNALGSPKASMTFGPFNKTEIYLSAGMGLHAAPPIPNSRSIASPIPASSRRH
jgi:hypothetical protein